MGGVFQLHLRSSESEIRVLSVCVWLVLVNFLLILLLLSCLVFCICLSLLCAMIIGHGVGEGSLLICDTKVVIFVGWINDKWLGGG